MDQQSPYMSIILMLLMFAIITPMIIGMWKIFKKAGYSGWLCLVPFYNLIVFLKIVGKPRWWALCILSNLLASAYGIAVSKTDAIYYGSSFLLTILVWVFGIWACNMLSKSFGKEEAFTAGIVILPLIFIPILGFGSAKYLGPYGNQELFREYNAAYKFDFENDVLA